MDFAESSKLFIRWMEHRLMVIYRGDALELTRKFSDPQKKSIYRKNAE